MTRHQYMTWHDVVGCHMMLWYPLLITLCYMTAHGCWSCTHGWANLHSHNDRCECIVGCHHAATMHVVHACNALDCVVGLQRLKLSLRQPEVLVQDREVTLCVVFCRSGVTVQCSAEQCSAVQCSAVQCSAVQCSAVQYKHDKRMC